MRKNEFQLCFDLDNLFNVEIKNEGISIKKNSNNPTNEIKVVENLDTLNLGLNDINNTTSKKNEVETISIEELEDLDISNELEELVPTEEFVEYTNRTLYNNDLKNAQTRLLSSEEELDYIRKIRSGDKKAREEFITHNLPLVVHFSKKFSVYTSTFHDLDIIQEGNLGLLKAVDKFDPSKGVKFSTFACMWINQAINRAIEEKARIIKIPNQRVQQIQRIKKFINKYKIENGVEPSNQEIAKELGCKVLSIEKALRYDCKISSINYHNTDDKDVELADILTDGVTVEDTLVSKENLKMLKHGFEKLDEEEKEIIVYRFFKNYKISQLERMLNISRNDINKKIDNILYKMKQSFKTKIS